MNLYQTHQKREMTKINKIGNGKGKVTIDIAEIQRIIRDYYKQWTIWDKCTNS